MSWYGYSPILALLQQALLLHMQRHFAMSGLMRRLPKGCCEDLPTQTSLALVSPGPQGIGSSERQMHAVKRCMEYTT